MSHHRPHGAPAPEFEFYASCPEGFESALADELRGLGLARVRPLKGRVSFAGAAADGERACLWSRLASRVFVVLARFAAVTAEELYEGTYQVAWEHVLKPGASIAVTARGTTDELRNTHFTALRVKDAICDRLADETGSRADVDTERPDARIAVSLRGERASLHLDLSGEPLFRRMPRAATKPGAPAHFLRPDYAALLLAQAGWSTGSSVGDAADHTAKPAAGPATTPAATPTSAAEPAATPTSSPTLTAAPTSAAEPTPAPATPLARTLLDPCCAGGGVALEAAYIARDMAPGLLRRHWGFEGWSRHDDDTWAALIEEADRRAEEGTAEPLGRILACSASGSVATYAQRVLRSAGMADAVTFLPARAEDVARELAKAPASLVIAADTTEVALANAQPLLAFASQLRALPACAAAPFGILARDDLFTRLLGRAPAVQSTVKPGNEPAWLRVWPALGGPNDGTNAPAGTTDTTGASAPDSPGQHDAASARRGSGASSQLKPTSFVDVGQGKPVPVLVAESVQFANRLKKNARLRRKWARRENISCYRVYDADLPDYAAAIDLYEGSPATPGRWLVVAEYAAPKTVDAGIAQARMLDILALAPRLLDVDPAHVFARTRTQSRGGSQYGKRTDEVSRAAQAIIEEGGLSFEVNFDSYLDTGIFLDHRITRGMLRDRIREAGGGRFLNLFAYTGTATCYAADAGAQETVTVDLSNTYLDWTERNLALNGFTGPEHHIVRADVMRWISDMRQTRNRWDLIFCDPPTFSNSAKMGRRTWDVQRDHAELLIGLSRLLTRGGMAIFSCNLRNFRPDTEALARAGVELTDITRETIPEDFARNQKIHHCYEVRRV